MEFNLFLPQMRLSFDDLVGRAAHRRSRGGFVGITGMDHLVPPLADDQPMFEAMVTTTWLAAHTERLRVGSLVLCDAFRHPGRARASSGVDRPARPVGGFELGIGWGSVPEEFTTFGVGSIEPRVRVDRLRETLEVVRALWAGEVVDYDGRYHQLHGARQEPRPVASHPDPDRRHRPEDARPRARVRRLVERARRPDAQDRGAALTSRRRAGVDPADGRPDRRDRDRDAVTTLATRRFGWSRPLIGTAPELVDYYGTLEERGVERVYTWFCDFAPRTRSPNSAKT